MEDFTEQYRREVLEQEIKSNKRTIKGFIWTFAAVGLMWILTMTGFFEVDRKLISIAFLATLVMLLPVLCIFVRVIWQMQGLSTRYCHLCVLSRESLRRFCLFTQC